MILIPGFNPSKLTLQGTNTYLLGTGAQRILIDTGEGKPQYLEHLKQTLDQQKCEIQIVLITHHHYDHIHGIPQILQLCPNVQIYKNLQFNLPEDGLYPFLPLQEGQIFQVEGCVLKAISQPGHCKDHFSFLSDKGEWFSGDCLLGGSSSYVIDLKPYFQSMEKILTMEIKTIHPGHGYQIMENAKETIQNQIQHRKNREQQIYQAINGTNIDEIVSVVYKDIKDENLLKTAKVGVNAHLIKLIDDGIVMQKDNLYYKL